MKQFKDLTVEEKLDLIEYYLRGGCILMGVDPKKQCVLRYEDDEDVLFSDQVHYQKDTTKLNNLYKELSSLKEQIAQEESLLGAPPQVDSNLPTQSLSEEEKTSEKASHVAGDVIVEGNTVKERVTVDNWKSLGVKAGDQVDVVDHEDIDNGVYHIWSIDDIGDGLPFELDEVFIGVGSCEELWLIRTEEGSL